MKSKLGIALAAAILAGCGGGGGGGGDSSSGSSSAAPTSISTAPAAASPAPAPAAAPAPDQWPVSQAAFRWLEQDFQQDMPENFKVSQKGKFLISRDVAATTAVWDKVRPRANGYVAASAYAQLMTTLVDGRMQPVLMSIASGVERSTEPVVYDASYSTCDSFKPADIQPLPIAATPPAGGTLGECVTDTNVTWAQDTTSAQEAARTILPPKVMRVTWSLAGDGSGYAKFCISITDAWRSRFCMRFDQSGNIDPSFMPWDG